MSVMKPPTQYGADVHGGVVRLNSDSYRLASWHCIALEDGNIFVAFLPETQGRTKATGTCTNDAHKPCRLVAFVLANCCESAMVLLHIRLLKCGSCILGTACDSIMHMDAQVGTMLCATWWVRACRGGCGSFSTMLLV